MSRYVCEPLASHHDRQAFRCGVQELDDYLRRRARQDMRRNVAAVFVMVSIDKPPEVVGYYTLCSASVLLSDLPAELARRLPRYPVVPAILLGRLARDTRFPGTGRLLLLDALSRSLRHSAEVAAAAVIVDAKNQTAGQFYAKYGFQPFSETPNRLFLPMKTIADSLTR